MTYFSFTRAELLRRAEEIPAGAKKALLLSGEKTNPYSTMIVVAENVLGKAEVHERSADAWMVLRGQGTFILGGRLIKPERHKEHEWLGEGIEGGTRLAVHEGDLLDIPPGIPHQIDVQTSRLELLIVKINQLESHPYDPNI
ncbi:hypothetical protein EXS71_04610 [Candidatus Uhrbacteria bacterium]|nr:hypothetical protein [Candidatus Uhrbacteria bacterium]